MRYVVISKPFPFQVMSKKQIGLGLGLGSLLGRERGHAKLDGKQGASERVGEGFFH
jgi:hypothetical protein